MYVERAELYKKLEEKLNSKLLVYVTSDRPGFEASIAQDVIDKFINQSGEIGVTEKISLYLYTRGGDAAAWNIINLLRQYCDTVTCKHSNIVIAQLYEKMLHGGINAVAISYKNAIGIRKLKYYWR